MTACVISRTDSSVLIPRSCFLQHAPPRHDEHDSSRQAHTRMALGQENDVAHTRAESIEAIWKAALTAGTAQVLAASSAFAAEVRPLSTIQQAQYSREYTILQGSTVCTKSTTLNRDTTVQQ